MTGSPRLVPIVRPLTRFRFFVLCTLVLAVWLLLMGWLFSLRHNTVSIRKTRDNPGATKSRKPGAATVNDSVGMEKSLHWMQREGIQYLGSIQILTSETTPDQAADSVLSEATEEEFDDAAQLQWSRYLYSIGLLKSISEGSLVLWIGLFAARVMFDPVWRELVMVAPLAALSRMISGI